MFIVINKQAPKINNITNAISVYHKIRQIVLEKNNFEETKIAEDIEK